MRKILEYLYLGQTSVSFSDVELFLAATKTLQIQDGKQECPPEADTEGKIYVDEEDQPMSANCKTLIKSEGEEEGFDQDEKTDLYDVGGADLEREAEEETLKLKGREGGGRGRGRPPKVREKPEKSCKFSCSQCDFVAAAKRPLQRHRREMHEASKLFHCEACEYTGTRAGLYAHREVHTNQRMYCDLCSYNTLKRVHFVNHKKYVHFQGERIACDLCDFTCKKEKDLRYHRERKHEGKCFVCDKCEYTSKYLHRLRDHIKGVHEDNKYRCSKCEYTTIHKSVLLTHTKVEHENRKKNLCTHCGFQTARKYNLDAHIKSMHYGIKRDQAKKNTIT